MGLGRSRIQSGSLDLRAASGDDHNKEAEIVEQLRALVEAYNLPSLKDAMDSLRTHRQVRNHIYLSVNLRKFKLFRHIVCSKCLLTSAASS